MQPQPAPLRIIIEDEPYKVAFEALKVSYRAMDRAFEQLSTTLSARPEIFPLVPGTQLRRIRVNGYGHMPDLNVWFTFDEQFVALRFVEVFDDGEV